MRKTVLISMLCAVLFSACATVKITEITPNAPYKDGLRFYRPELFLLVTEDKDGNFLNASVISLPDRTQEYVLRSTIGIGAVEMSATLEGGWNLTALGANIDSKVPETINAITAAAQATRAASLQPSPLPLKLGLYQIIFTAGKVSSLKKIELSR
jgi:hypothetical protein